MANVLTGHAFGPYFVEALIGVGGMGSVYRAHDASLGRPIALKVLRSRDGAAPSDEDRARFVREARLAAGLRHPNIVTIHASGAIGTTPYIAMEWIGGATLAARMADPSLPLSSRIDVITAVADALAYAHANGVVHRDLKPSNVMLDAAGAAKLVDFGIAKQEQDRSQPLHLAHTLDGVPFATRTGVVLGTPSYMAPEQMISPDVDARVDQFAWGVLSYELLSGVHPRDTVAPGTGSFPVARPRPLGWQCPDAPDALTAIVHRAMAYERDARFSSMAELVRALRAAKSATASSRASISAPLAYPTTNGTMRAVVGNVLYPTMTDAPAPRTPPKTARWVLLSAMALVLSAGGIALVSVLLARQGDLVVPFAAPRAFVLSDGFADVPFEGGALALARAREAAARAFAPCTDARMVVEDEIKVTFRVDADGAVMDVSEIDYCRRRFGNYWLCSEMGKPVKRDYPEPPSGALRCVHDAARGLTLPRLRRGRTLSGKPPAVPGPVEVTLELDVR